MEKSFAETLKGSVEGTPFLQNFSGTSVAMKMLERLAAFKPGHTCSLADVYGAFLAYQWAKGKPEERVNSVLSSQAQLIRQYHKPIPVYGAAQPDDGSDPSTKDEHEYHIYEFTPFEVQLSSSCRYPYALRIISPTRRVLW